MLMVLENDTMNLIDPLGQTLLHAQPIGSIRVWGVGRDNGRSVSTDQGQNEDGWFTRFVYPTFKFVLNKLYFKKTLIIGQFVLFMIVKLLVSSQKTSLTFAYINSTDFIVIIDALCKMYTFSKNVCFVSVSVCSMSFMTCVTTDGLFLLVWIFCHYLVVCI